MSVNFDLTQRAGGGSAPNLQAKSKTYTANTAPHTPDVITPDSGYDGLSEVEVTVNVTANLQSKVVNITGNTGINIPLVIQPDSGYDGLSRIQANVAVLYAYTKIFTTPSNAVRSIDVAVSSNIIGMSHLLIMQKTGTPSTGGVTSMYFENGEGVWGWRGASSINIAASTYTLDITNLVLTIATMSATGSTGIPFRPECDYILVAW